MSKNRSQQYKQEITEALNSTRLNDALHQFGDAYLDARARAFVGLDFESLRTEIAAMKDRVLATREELRDQFIRNARAAGAKVYIAKDADEANLYITELATANGVRKVVKSKSMVSEEIHLNAALEKAGVQAVETDLGEWIIQLAGQRPSHMVMPAIHMFRDQVAELFSEATGHTQSDDIEHLVAVARKQLRREYLEADMGISGANVAIADSGTFGLVTNEGNARLVMTLPKIHVALIGMEKLVPTMDDALNIVQVLPRNATGQAITSYVSWIRGAVPCGNAPCGDKNKELHIVLLDNGREKLAKSESCKDALRCIRCGACANVCPVYQSVGGHVFGHTYIGAIGIILTAFYDGIDKAAELVKACIGCRACVSVCPSKIDLEEIILSLRQQVQEHEGLGLGKSLMFRKVMRNRRLFHTLLRSGAKMQKPVTGGSRTIRHLPLFFSSLTEWRSLPALANKPLRDLLPKQEQKLNGVDSPRYRVAMFGGCANDFIYPELGLDLLKVLNHFGVEIYFPEKQNCCGIPALYSGDRETAQELARQNVAALLENKPDYVLTTCPTCTVSLQRDSVELLADEPEFYAKAQQLAAITCDASSFLRDVLQVDMTQIKTLQNVDSEPLKVTYHDSCHLKRGVGVWQQPRQLLHDSGHDVVEMSRADRCCGFGGSYSFTGHPDIANAILTDKLNDIKNSGANCVVMDCPGCMMQIGGGLDHANSPVRVAHTITLLAETI